MPADPPLDLNERILSAQAEGPGAEVFARQARAWADDLAARLAAAAHAAPAELPGRLHELRSLSHVVGARGLAAAAAALEQRVEAGELATAADHERLAGIASRHRDAIVAWWRTHGRAVAFVPKAERST